ncbi:MAG: ParB/RepB/Spo0J family partition protein [Trichormus sp.]
MSKKDTAYTTKLKHANPLDLMFGGEDSEVNTPKKPIASIKREKIKLDPTQPRRYFDPQKLEELAQSIKAVGILEPLLVRPLEEGDYELIAGERRFISAGIAYLEEVPVVIKDMDDETVKQVRLIENLQREDLNAYEETIAILELLALRLKVTQDKVISLLNWMGKAKRKKADNVIRQDSGEEADNVIRQDSGEKADNVIRQDSEEKTGNIVRQDSGEKADNVIRSKEIEIIESIFMGLGRLSPESFRTNRLPLLNLPQDIQQALSQGKIEYTKARVIAKLKSEDKRKQLLQEAIESNLSLSDIQKRVQNILSEEKGGSTSPSLKSQYRELSKQLGSSKVWDNPHKKKTLEKLINQIKLLLDEEQTSSEN